MTATFGSDATYRASLARHNALYGADAGRAILDAQRDFSDVVEAAARPASAKSVEFLVTLWMERSDKATAEQVRAWGVQQTQAVVSTKIDWLKTQPKLTPRALVPAGRYAITGNAGQTVFLRVSEGGRVSVQAGSEFRPVAQSTGWTLTAKVKLAGAENAMIRYGRELGVCGRCGRELTNEESREAGIGPVCLSKRD
jgi:hypothetical protein